jgi:hypothetical protein
MAIWSRLTSAIAGIAIGGAGAAAVEPVLEVPKQEAWKGNANRILDLGTLAHLVTQGLISEAAVTDHAQRNGYSADKLQALIQLNLRAPGVPEVLELWRRNASRPASEQITEAQVDHALAKAQIEPQYWPAVKELFSERLDPAVIAVAIQRGIMRDPGFLPVGPPAAQGKVPKFPVSGLDPLAEAISSGVTQDRLFVETAIVGNPASPDLAARMTFRDIIERVDFDRAISEGNTRNEWADFLFEGFRQIVTAHDGVEGRLRGWLDDTEMYAQTARHGMSKEDTDLLLKITGRPISEHQVVTGEARGGTYDGSSANIPAAFLKSLQESNIRPEWYSLAYANRYSYPSAFFFRLLGTTGTLKQPDLEQAFLELGWSPKWAKLISDALTASKSGAQKEATAADLLTLYDGGKLDPVQIIADLEALGYPADEAQRKVDLLDARRVVGSKQSAIGDLHTEYKKGGLTGDAATNGLLALGVASDSAVKMVASWQVFLDALAASAPPSPPPAA